MIKLLTFLLPIVFLFTCTGSTSQTQEGDTSTAPKKELVSIVGKRDSLYNVYHKPISDSLLPDYLETDTLELPLDYVVWGCPCPPWIEQSKKRLCQKNDIPYNGHVIYLEAADSSNRIALDKFNAKGLYYAVVKGVFYKEKGYPREVGQRRNQVDFVYPAKVFRYFKSEVKKKVRPDTLGIKKK